jgi:hypothetical protein
LANRPEVLVRGVSFGKHACKGLLGKEKDNNRARMKEEKYRNVKGEN